MFESPIGHGAQVFLLIVIIGIAFVSALSVIDVLKVKEKNKEKKD